LAVRMNFISGSGLGSARIMFRKKSLFNVPVLPTYNKISAYEAFSNPAVHRPIEFSTLEFAPSKATP
jgi:hypothetical protein